MAAPSRQAPKPLSWRLREKPQAFEFLQALLLLERERPDATPLGQGSSPDDEALRLRGPLTPTFAASQVVSLEEQPGQPPVLSSAVFGLGGPDGPLPYAYQEWLQQRARHKDHAPAEFLDLFHNRLLAQLYRVLSRHRLALGFQPPERAPVHQPLLALAGLLPHSLQQRMDLPDAALTARAALFNGPRRSLAGFAVLVRHQFGVAVDHEAYQGAWRDIPPASRSRLQRGGRNLGLGRDAIAGTRVWDEHAGVRLTLGPLSTEQANTYLPGGAQHQRLADLAGLYLGPDMDCHLHLLVSPGAPLRLDRRQPPRLRWSGGLHLAAGSSLQRIDIRLRFKEMP
ncbi:type VI secretion system baseplate subunit TssG [Pseudomonas toyotomiensis]|jgi:type VI secretion system protein ImpH|uniref:Type VI secretion system baseplate subunit TssG n=1 Tax=Ectopseudomonas toyotomiensis TaxID=554344 RepID=A0AA42IRR3_9GAMM|nr:MULTISPECIES: type VI secretion system baseplate subunit TssG [Pseudomonas]MBG0848469.1 type VI secretion system baseplate subunit TssG [Pseudomonas chengduensis]MDH0704320.1 type VI secretion system baseplate subunit TssG [Pseudomonas toyotomiensis]